MATPLFKGEPGGILALGHRMAQKCVIVAGGASGIGRAFTELALALGSEVHILDFNQGGWEAAVAELSSFGYTGTVYGRTLDVTKEGDCEDAVGRIAADFGRPDIAVSCVGIVKAAGPGGNTVADARAMMDTNYFGNMAFIKAAVAEMKPAGGKIACLGSVVGELSLGGRDGYCASKGALHRWAMTAAIEYARFGITLNILAPGRVLTALVRNWVMKDANPAQAFRDGCATQISGKMMLPEQVAWELLGLVGGTNDVTGTVRDLSDGWGTGFGGHKGEMPPAFAPFRQYAIDTLGMQGI